MHEPKRKEKKSFEFRQKLKKVNRIQRTCAVTTLKSKRNSRKKMREKKQKIGEKIDFLFLPNQEQFTLGKGS